MHPCTHGLPPFRDPPLGSRQQDAEDRWKLSWGARKNRAKTFGHAEQERCRYVRHSSSVNDRVTLSCEIASSSSTSSAKTCTPAHPWAASKDPSALNARART